ncbi:MAG: hypothetical protein Q8N51_20560 [Gammaproteobacteria bacterium]|nr:hypothetical protein [Gammaproteobacteria bacterium]
MGTRTRTVTAKGASIVQEIDLGIAAIGQYDDALCAGITTVATTVAPVKELPLRNCPRRTPHGQTTAEVNTKQLSPIKHGATRCFVSHGQSGLTLTERSSSRFRLPDGFENVRWQHLM